MKKKNLQNLQLHKYKIANLALLHAKKGGTVTTDTTTGTDANPNNPDETQVVTNCQTLIDKTKCGDLTSCPTNGSDTKVPPPTEYHTCAYNIPGFSG